MFLISIQHSAGDCKISLTGDPKCQRQLCEAARKRGVTSFCTTSVLLILILVSYCHWCFFPDFLDSSLLRTEASFYFINSSASVSLSRKIVTKSCWQLNKLLESKQLLLILSYVQISPFTYLKSLKLYISGGEVIFVSLFLSIKNK